MGAPRRKNLIVSRRRTDDDGEEGESPVGQDDLSSLGSATSEPDVDADADAEGSDGSGAVTSKKGGLKKRNGYDSTREQNGKTPEQKSPPKSTNFSSKMTDTEAMMNGLRIADEQNEGEAIAFDEIVQPTSDERPQAPETAETSMGKAESLADRRRREHEEYKKKRDEDPTFIPNRGGFFMHDQRSAAVGHNGFRPAGRGRGRGRGTLGVPPAFK